ncbi:unnamed protein product, partial [Nesidiocoris tenuis]
RSVRLTRKSRTAAARQPVTVDVSEQWRGNRVDAQGPGWRTELSPPAVTGPSLSTRLRLGPLSMRRPQPGTYRPARQTLVSY